MGPESVMTIGRDAMQVTLMVAAPILLVILVIGLAVSIFQAATQINDAALAFIPKVTATVVALLVFGNWMTSKMTYFAIFAFEQIALVHP
jgi:flagellar biosynthetic protein FliQ